MEVQGVQGFKGFKGNLLNLLNLLNLIEDTWALKRTRLQPAKGVESENRPILD
jgi:hypothetical protein